MYVIPKPPAEDLLQNEPRLADLIPGDGQLIRHLSGNIKQTLSYLQSLPEDKLLYRYDKGKWTIKEILIHLADMERIYSYRALCIARNDHTDLPGFDAERYVLESDANGRTLPDLLAEFTAVRQATIAMITGLQETHLQRWGTIYGYRASVPALLYHIAGHELHHVRIIKERY